MKLNLKPIDNIVWFTFGFIVLSRFSAYLLLDLLRFPVYLPELLILSFLPYIVYRNKEEFFSIFNHGKKLVFILLSFWLLIFTISFLFNDYGVKYIFATSKGYLHILIAFVIGMYITKFDLKSIYYICLGSISSAFLWLLFIPVLPGEVYYLNLSCLFLLILIPIINNNISKIYYLLPLVMYVSITSGLRRAILVIILALLIGIIHNLFLGSSIRKKIYIMLIALTLLIFSVPIINLITSWLYGNTYLFERIIVKNAELIYEGGSVGDNNRLLFISEIGDYIKNSLVPRGFITKNPDLTQDGRFMDIPIYELLYTFSSFVIIPFLIFLFYKALKIYVKFKDSILVIIPQFIILISVFVVLDGGFLYWFYQTVFTGYFLGLMFNKNLNKWYQRLSK